MDKFWARVKKGGDDDCWEWQMRNGQTAIGYGAFIYNGKARSAHRIAYELTYGPVPEGLFVCHRCDNNPCCNPRHLYAGTHEQNNLDRTRNRAISKARREALGAASRREAELREAQRLMEQPPPEPPIPEPPIPEPPIPEPKCWQELPISGLYLGERPYKRLREAGYETVGQVAKASNADLLALKGFGKSCLAQVRYAVKIDRSRYLEELVESGKTLRQLATIFGVSHETIRHWKGYNPRAGKRKK